MVGIYSDDTDTSYESWEDLVAAEANGWAVIAVSQKQCKKQLRTAAAAYGPYESQEEAKAMAAKIRRELKKDTSSGYTIATTTISPIWDLPHKRISKYQTNKQ